jgi:DNA-binding NarL/FixJ family response regulator
MEGKVMPLHHKYRVLLVDDYVPVRITLRSMLTGYPDLQIVGEACDGKQAIEQVAACQPDIILMDYNMPVMNGIEAARLIKKSWETTVIIGLCTVPDTCITDGFLNAGALAVIHKERIEHLHSTIQRVFPESASSDRLVAQP